MVDNNRGLVGGIVIGLFVTFCIKDGELLGGIILFLVIVSYIQKFSEYKETVKRYNQRLDDKMNRYFNWRMQEAGKIEEYDVYAMVHSFRCCHGRLYNIYPMCDIWRSEYSDAEICEWLYDHYYWYTKRSLEQYGLCWDAQNKRICRL